MTSRPKGPRFGAETYIVRVVPCRRAVEGKGRNGLAIVERGEKSPSEFEVSQNGHGTVNALTGAAPSLLANLDSI